MNQQFITPRVIVSKCLTFAPCRYDGSQINDQFVSELKDYVEFIPVCPEVEIGLGAPRKPVRLVNQAGKKELIQRETKKNLTKKMINFSQDFLNSQSEIDGLLLKNRSPSCGSRDTKVYPDLESKVPSETDSGLFAEQAKKQFPNAAVTNEGRLKNFRLREDFLTKLFTLARFRKVKESQTMNQLVQFQAENKLLLLSYNEQEMRKLGKITSNPDDKSTAEIIADYEQHLQQALNSDSKYTANINVLMHAFGYFSDDLNSSEKDYFLSTLEKYRHNQVPLSVPIGILKSWIIKYDVDYLAQQTFFSPYPEELVKITDSGKGREL